MNAVMIGDGAWGGAVAHLLERNGHTVRFVRRTDHAWPDGSAGDMVFVAIPCQALRSRLQELPSPQAPVISLIKGIEVDAFLRPTQIINEIWPTVPVATISGPSFAHEVRDGLPTAAVVASELPHLSEHIQESLHQCSFRLYRSDDLIGVELGGALKNIYAIAGGLCGVLGVGSNGMAALMTRSLAEMGRIAAGFGAKRETLFGLSGVGDLMLTAYSGSSRNHQVGESLGRGEKLENILNKLKGTAEGVPTTRAIHQWVARRDIKAPIVAELHAVLFEGKSPQASMTDLMGRQACAEE